MLIGDSAFGLAQYPTEFDGQPVVGWCVYIGGDAYHVWTEAEITHLRDQAHIRYLLPIYVRSNPAGAAQAASDVASAIAWAKAHGQPRGTLTQWDYETAVDAGYEEAVSRLLLAGDGDLELLYGSKSTVTKNPAPAGGYQIADWTNTIPAALASTGQQFYGGPDDDMNAFAAGAPLWDLRPAPVPPAPPTPVSTVLQEDDMQQIEPLATHPGEYAFVAPAGATELALLADGYSGPAASLRIAIWVGDKPGVLDGVKIGGSSGVHSLGHPLPAGCTGVTVRREDSQTYPVGISFK